MKAIVSRSILIGIAEMTFVALVSLGFAFFSTSPELPILVRLGFSNVSLLCTIPVVLPVIIVIVTWVTRRATHTLLKDIGVTEAKKRLMVSVWLSSLFATLPILFPSTMVLVLSNTSPSLLPDFAGLGIVFSAVLLILNITFVVLAGLAARSMIKNERLS